MNQTKQEFFTLSQMLQFAAYRRVQDSGKWNMFDPRARMATGLSKEQLLFVMENYDALQKQNVIEVRK